jgi:hypothetical protein
MTIEPVSEILLCDNHLHLVLSSGGNESYVHIYREAASIYWDPARRSFKCSVVIPGLPLPNIVPHLVQVVRHIGIGLTFPPPFKFTGLLPPEIESIRAEIAKL